MKRYLDQINSPSDLRQLNEDELLKTASELREFIIKIVAENGGHLGASLGTVELTTALHYCFNTPEDRIIWDVGHQAYGHKIITGRRDQFHLNRKHKGLSGFPKRSESEYDTFGTGHSSTSIGAALGMAKAAKLLNQDRCHIPVIGDAAMQAGMAFEALNHLGSTDENVLVILNDNHMSIDEGVGALNNFLKEAAATYLDGENIIREQLKKSTPADKNLFEDLHIRYFGPMDGHDLPLLVKTLKQLKDVPGPKLLHVKTVKGKGYAPAESGNATHWHSPGTFDVKTGKVLKQDPEGDHFPEKYQDVFGKTLVELADNNRHIIGITPAMPTGSSLTYMMEKYPERAVDVGIAEQHAVTYSAGLAAEGLLPFCVVYSTFLQRAYDQVIHDTAIQNLKVVFCIDRAGLVGGDGGTHQGAYDMAYLRCIPNLTVAAPMNEQELRNMMFTSQTPAFTGPAAIRYPRGRGVLKEYDQSFQSIEPGKGRRLSKGEKTAVLSIGAAGNEVLKTLQKLESDSFDTLPSHYDMRFVKPLDKKLLDEICKRYSSVITVEDGCISGGFGSAVSEYISEKRNPIPVIKCGIPDRVIEQGTQEEQKAECGFDAESLMRLIKKIQA